VRWQARDRVGVGHRYVKKLSTVRDEGAFTNMFSSLTPIAEVGREGQLDVASYYRAGRIIRRQFAIFMRRQAPGLPEKSTLGACCAPGAALKYVRGLAPITRAVITAGNCRIYALYCSAAWL
jgi:hypothetical protein